MSEPFDHTKQESYQKIVLEFKRERVLNLESWKKNREPYLLAWTLVGRQGPITDNAARKLRSDPKFLAELERCIEEAQMEDFEYARLSTQ